MNTSKKNTSSLHAVAEQITNNTTGWIGHIPGNNEIVSRGQTFVAREEGNLHNIEVYSNIVSDPGQVVMTLHHFDLQQRSWGPAIGSASVELKKDDSGKWIAFNIPGLRLDKGKAYGFRLDTKDCYIGVGEAAGSSMQPPFNTGQEWEFTNDNQSGDCFSYFSLAFRVGVVAA